MARLAPAARTPLIPRATTGSGRPGEAQWRAQGVSSTWPITWLQVCVTEVCQWWRKSSSGISRPCGQQGWSWVWHHRRGLRCWAEREKNWGHTAASTAEFCSWTTSCTPSTWDAMASETRLSVTFVVTAVRTATSSHRTSRVESTASELTHRDVSHTLDYTFTHTQPIQHFRIFRHCPYIWFFLSFV